MLRDINSGLFFFFDTPDCRLWSSAVLSLHKSWSFPSAVSTRSRTPIPIFIYGNVRTLCFHFFWDIGYPYEHMRLPPLCYTHPAPYPLRSRKNSQSSRNRQVFRNLIWWLDEGWRISHPKSPLDCPSENYIQLCAWFTFAYPGHTWL